MMKKVIGVTFILILTLIALSGCLGEGVELNESNVKLILEIDEDEIDMEDGLISLHFYIKNTENYKVKCDNYFYRYINITSLDTSQSWEYASGNGDFDGFSLDPREKKSTLSSSQRVEHLGEKVNHSFQPGHYEIRARNEERDEGFTLVSNAVKVEFIVS